MTQPKKQSDLRGQGNQNLKGVTNVQAIRDTDQNTKSKNRPQSAAAEHPNQKLATEK